MAKAKENHDTKHLQADRGEQRSGSTASQPMQTAGGRNPSMPTQFGLAQRGYLSPLLFASPFSVMRRFAEQMDRLIEDYQQNQAVAGTRDITAWAPQVEIYEHDGELVVRTDLPGLTPEDVEVEVRDNALLIRGERRQEHEEQGEGFYRCEVSHGSFYRQIPLPEGVDAQNAKAVFRDGVLEISMQAPQKESGGRKLQIEDARAAEQQQTRARAVGGRG